MTQRLSTLGGRAGTDFHHMNSTVVLGCSPNLSTLADDSSEWKIPSISPHRRESLRLKPINAIYKAEYAMSSIHQQTSGYKCSISSEMESISSLDDPTINVTLKDMKKRSKSRKRKASNSVASSTSVLQLAPMIPKEEEPDLEEPLIFLKLKRPIKTFIGRKHRKHSHVSEANIPVDETTVQMAYPSFCGEVSSPAAKEEPSVAKEGVAEDGPNTIPEGVDDNSEVTSDGDPIHGCGSDLSYTVKREIVETRDTVSSSSVDIDNYNALGGSSIELSQKVCEDESTYGDPCSFSNKFLHPCVASHTEMVLCHSSPSSSNMAAPLLLHISQSVNEVRCEVAESDLQGSRSVSDSGNSSSELCKIIDRGESVHEDVYSFTSKSMDCCIREDSFKFVGMDCRINLQESVDGLLDCCCADEVSNEFMEHDNYSNLAESGKECHGEKIEQDSSERSSHKLSPSISTGETPTLPADNSQLVSSATDFGLDLSDRARTLNSTSEEIMHDNIMSQMDNLDIADSQECAHENSSIEFSMREEFHNQSKGIHVPEMSICTHENNLTAEQSLLRGYIHNLQHTSGFSEEIGSLDSLVHKAICVDAWRNSIEDPVISHIDRSHLLGTYDLGDPQHSSTSASSSCDPHAASVGSKRTEGLHCSTMDEILNRCTENTGKFADAGELANCSFERTSEVEDCDLCVRQHSDMSIPSACDLHDASGSAPKTESLHYSTLDQLLKSHSEDADTSAEIDAEEPVKTHGLHLPQASPPDSANGLHNVRDSLSEAAKRIQSSAEVIPVDNYASSEMPNLVQDEGSNMEDELICNQGMKSERHPKKLLSNRTDLSPTSQERLRQAFGRNESANSIISPDHEETEARPRPEKMTKRSRSISNGSPLLSKGILKPQDALDRKCSCSKNSLIHVQAEKAITFSQRQMQDIESIATKLLKGLTSMKNIVEESIGSEACPSAPSNFTPAETRMAVESASNLESTTKKWLSMMAKDCTRFCKIMKSTENKGADPSGARRQPKKITFADEAGGLLCHVKVFQQGNTSFIAPRNDF